MGVIVLLDKKMACAQFVHLVLKTKRVDFFIFMAKLKRNNLLATDIRRRNNSNLNLSESYQFLHGKEVNGLILRRNILINKLKKENEILALENVKLLDEITILKKAIDSS